MITIYYWPYGTWCFCHELPWFNHLSDDFGTLQVPLTMTDEQINFLVDQLVTIGE